MLAGTKAVSELVQGIVLMGHAFFVTMCCFSVLWVSMCLCLWICFVCCEHNVCVRRCICCMHDEYLPARAHANVYVLCMCQCSSCVVWVCARVYVHRYANVLHVVCARVYVHRYANVLHVVCARVYVHRYVCLILLSVLQSFFANYNTYSMMWYTWGTWRNMIFPCIIFLLS